VRKTSVSPNEIINQSKKFSSSLHPLLSTLNTVKWVINAAEDSETVAFELPFDNIADSGTAQVLTDPGSTSSTLDEPDAIVRKTSDISVGQSFSHEAPGFSVSVLTFTAE